MPCHFSHTNVITVNVIATQIGSGQLEKYSNISSKETNYGCFENDNKYTMHVQAFGNKNTQYLGS